MVTDYNVSDPPWTDDNKTWIKSEFSLSADEVNELELLFKKSDKDVIRPQPELFQLPDKRIDIEKEMKKILAGAKPVGQSLGPPDFASDINIQPQPKKLLRPAKRTAKVEPNLPIGLTKPVGQSLSSPDFSSDINVEPKPKKLLRPIKRTTRVEANLPTGLTKPATKKILKTKQQGVPTGGQPVPIVVRVIDDMKDSSITVIPEQIRQEMLVDGYTEEQIRYIEKTIATKLSAGTVGTSVKKLATPKPLNLKGSRIEAAERTITRLVRENRIELTEDERDQLLDKNINWKYVILHASEAIK
ncbi:hypothetical protein LCGC14_0504050 [marine sediment metagenome]|uniref:Uncharacterized protein n=1 Tax=marine sediment metagenome TaxID=412755 RepID=A0A0F9S312_9ZZZZ